MAKHNGNRLRIIGGQWRSRQLPFPDVEGLRPTTDRVRETLFNWLQPYLPGANVLDVFAGSGALGLEALSREAGQVTLIEKNQKATKQLQDNIRTLNAQNSSIHMGDALQILPTLAKAFDVIFLDPPFGKGLLPNCINTIEQHNLISPNGWIYIESEQALTELDIPKHWRLHREKKAGQVMLRLFQIMKDTA
ncbi:16S rRNA (guanine(966)-N(2))-methyltransferase [Oceaniserpentilla sp. 4NH20-0058]|uniref:16S rRNA (guanine(966)-N(2))-methyltransferase RsmD n=1 Tax=Oceaniserpentilla sp. 4NH20-0058 TaxID=3127660 RepID=UPI00310B7274